MGVIPSTFHVDFSECEFLKYVSATLEYLHIYIISAVGYEVNLVYLLDITRKFHRRTLKFYS